MTDTLKAHQFQPGNPGGPGRPKGARAKLGEAFLVAMLESFQKGGIAAIEKVRSEDPTAYVKTIASILPKEMTGENGEPLFSGIEVKFVKGDKK
jgi:hypothetical protein